MDRRRSRKIADEKSKIVGRFNLQLKNLIQLTNNLVPDNKELEMMNMGARRLNSHLGDAVLLKIGPELYAHRTDILDKNFNFLTEIDYTEKLRGRQSEFQDSDKIDVYIQLTSLLTSVYNKCDTNTRDKIHTFLSKLLLEYLLYVKHCRTHNY